VLVSEPTAERTEYEAVLASSQFAGETNSKRFLKYVCDKHFAGITHVSEHEIAIEALGRRNDFDPSQDSIVRVEAHRVRKRLRDHYELEAPNSALRLVLPQGSYLPQFVPASRADAEGQSPPVDTVGQVSTSSPASAPRTSRRTIPLVALWVCAGLIIAGLIFGFWRRAQAPVQKLVPAAAAPLAVGVPSSDVLIMAGSSAGNYTDQLGHVWTGDRYFSGGQSWPVRYRRIRRTDDPQLFLTARQGAEFGYDIPLQPGLYELRLYFAETFYGDDNSEGGGESSRMFDVSANGLPLLTSFDPLSDAGGSNTADVRVFPGLSPAKDGKLHLWFRNPYQLKGVAFVNAIQLTHTVSNRMMPIRWVAAASAIEDGAGRLWLPDQYVQGGRRRELSEVVAASHDPELYKSERYGNFSYAIPVAENGTYTVTLFFSEHWFGVPNFGGAGNGLRVFDVYCNGVYLLKDFDIYKEAGGSLKAISRTFQGLRPNHQGKLLLSFVPNQNYASVTAIEVMPER
jgi:hypothetical protein